MSYSPSLGSTISNTHMRTPANLSEFSGLCAVCTVNCSGTCEIGLSAVRGSEAIYPYAADVNQFASEKKYPVDFSHLNINGRVFGAFGVNENSDEASFPNARIECSFGKAYPIQMKAPIILPAMAKLNWKDYFSGAALAGVLAVIGEDVVAKDPALVLENEKVVDSPLLAQMVSAYKSYQTGYGDIVVQANEDDERLGVLEYAIKHLGVETVELKFGQAAKGIQGMGRIKTIEEATRLKQMGYLVFPDPLEDTVKANYTNGVGPTFEKVGKLPVWNEIHLLKRVISLKQLGAKRICFKTGPFDTKDLAQLLKIASISGVDLVTFDGAGGGTGNSPAKMMNEWGIPTIQLESLVVSILDRLVELGYDVPQVAITGGIAMEDQVFKALALGAPHIRFVGLGRAAMAAAMTGKQIGELINSGNTPKEYVRFGQSVETIFENYKTLALEHGDTVQTFSPGAIGVYSYIERVSTGLKQLMALNRKFDLSYLSKDDLIAMTDISQKITQIDSLETKLSKELESLG